VWNKVILSIAVSLAVVSPWLVRNYKVFGRPVFVRSNFGAEVFFGNLGFNSHPLGPTLEYQKQGELQFVAEKQHAVEEYIRLNAGSFAIRSLQRMLSFWIVPKISSPYWAVMSAFCFIGLAMSFRDRSGFAPECAIVLLIYPMPYYVSYIFEKYRHPIEPLIIVLASYPFVRGVQFVLKWYAGIRLKNSQVLQTQPGNLGS
jgi:hypothetical protein